MIRGIQLKDCSRVAEIHVFGWRNAYRGIIPDEVLFDKLQVKRCIDYFEKAVQENNEETYVFEEDGLIKGFMTMGEARSEAEDCFELWGLYVEPLMIGGGIGTTFVKFCEREAIRRGYAKNTLWVLEDNLLARHFYEKNGYKVTGKIHRLEKLKVVEIQYVKLLNNADKRLHQT